MLHRVSRETNGLLRAYVVSVGTALCWSSSFSLPLCGKSPADTLKRELQRRLPLNRSLRVGAGDSLNQTHAQQASAKSESKTVCQGLEKE